MAWCRNGGPDSLTHICSTRGRWVNNPLWGEPTSQAPTGKSPVTHFFVDSFNKLLNKQYGCQWFEAHVILLSYELQWLDLASWGWFNINMPSCQYRKFHCGDKMISWLSYLHNGFSYTGTRTYLYWIKTQDSTPSNNCQNDIPYCASLLHHGNDKWLQGHGMWCTSFRQPINPMFNWFFLLGQQQRDHQGFTLLVFCMARHLTRGIPHGKLEPSRVSNSYDQPQLPPTNMAPAENGESKQSRISSTSSNTNWHNHVLIQGSR